MLLDLTVQLKQQGLLAPFAPLKRVRRPGKQHLSTTSIYPNATCLHGVSCMMRGKFC